MLFTELDRVELIYFDLIHLCLSFGWIHLLQILFILIIQANKIGVVHSDIKDLYFSKTIKPFGEFLIEVEYVFQELHHDACQSIVNWSFVCLLSWGLVGLNHSFKRLVVAAIQLQILIKKAVGVGDPEAHLEQNSTNYIFPILLFSFHVFDKHNGIIPCGLWH